MTYLKCLLDPVGSQKALEEFGTGSTSYSVSALVGTWIKEFTRVIDMITIKLILLASELVLLHNIKQ